jgi:hypothetical protein
MTSRTLPCFSSRRLLPLLLAALLGACGGGSGGGPATPAGNNGNGGDSGGAGPGTTRVLALGSSASTVSIAWAPVAGTDGYRLQRAGAVGDWVTVAELPEQARSHVDAGLQAGQPYRYRLLAVAGGRELAQADATTGSDAPVPTAVAPAGAELLRGSVGTAGGRLATGDGLLVVEVPAGAFAAATQVVLRRIANTAPGGQGDGVELAASAAPARPLRLTMPQPEAGGDVALAVQQGDGSWLSLPTVARDGHPLQAMLPPGLGRAGTGVAAGGVPQPARAALTAPRWVSTTAPAAAGDGFTVHVVRYGRLSLDPATASAPVNGRVVLTPHARTLLQHVECIPEVDGADDCLPVPVLDWKPVPLQNQKAGYTREWRVQDIVGGTPALGTTVAPPGGSGAFYLAPARAPAPNPVTVTFRSTHQASGRTIALHATVEVREPYWTGTTQGTLGGDADLAFTFGADAIWSMGGATGTDPAVERYGAAGTQIVSVVNLHCTASATPSTAALPAGALVVDTRSVPARYTLDLGSLWPTVITGTCPGQPGQAQVSMTVPGRLQVEGTVSADGRRIVGSATLGNVAWTWFFERRD